ncbi:unnamed protein product [Oncorhynchus mykiss]|uniref:Uncharacterized protein n=1 Tax=Oncorhynchus mykiss TaxID=8022 RepID=A0A060Z2X4_ONCMY|nr:unnamed protein product [Oncorhynchus mykiss]
MFVTQEMWSSPDQSTGSDITRGGSEDYLLPASPATALHRRLPGGVQSPVLEDVEVFTERQMVPAVRSLATKLLLSGN